MYVISMWFNSYHLLYISENNKQIIKIKNMKSENKTINEINRKYTKKYCTKDIKSYKI